MSGDEVIRTMSYALIVPTFLYFAFVHWNHGERIASVVLGCLSLFFFLLMLGQVLLSYFAPSYELLMLNTGIVATIATGGLLAIYEFRRRRKRVSAQWSELDDVVKHIKATRQGHLPGR